ncbi:L-asparaginase [Azorhizobium oxalatiphilum]|uniref:L-asparaginase n=1 Tax=Azorhizobium oxalatiphilum TaxID=980631 RepID=A0A917C4J3_9HYPH|nr:L-asparaginase [Azorhizobium oxalatiphilum]
MIGFIGCGGTIGSLADDPLDVIDYPEHGRKISARELLERVPDAARFASFKVQDFSRVSSSAIGPAEWLQLRRDVLALAAEGAQGIVITHGTGTLEETAFFLHLTLDLDIPVVLTGAQRPASAVGSDAPANLIAAVRVACAPQARGQGVLVVLNDEVHSAAQVVKTSTYRLQTFQSPETGPLGTVDGDRIILRRGLGDRPQAFSLDSQDPDLPAVHIAYSYAGADGTAIRAAVAAGARGIVSAGFAPGIPTPAESAALEDAHRQGVIIVQSSRALHGRVAARLALREKGWLAGHGLNPQKARILLMLCLNARLDHATMETRLSAFG